MKLADYSAAVTVDQLDAALRAGGFEGVFHYTSGSFARRIESVEVVEGIRARGWPQLAIDVPHLGTVDGAGAARAAIAHGLGARSLLALDIEPAEFDADPAGWAAAADRWCPAVRAAGLSPGVYGVDRTVAACANHADWIWRAKPGQCDPAGPGLAADFFAGRRIVQCGAGAWGGVEMDVSFSQFTAGGPEVLDPNDPIVAEIRKQLTGLFNGWFMDDALLRQLLAAVQAVKPIDADQLAAALVAHLPAGADAQAVAQAVIQQLAGRLSAPSA